MEKLERIYLYFFIILLSVGWITNPLLEELLNLEIGIMGFMGVSTYLLVHYIYRKGNAKSGFHAAGEMGASSVLAILLVIGVLYWI
ncbi:hypothetical protein GCM10010954_26490 [Halobacillus andaensis]|uniref:Uncharacterized protein n=1 Tax=Halobacillus andaensis TaxID=1176239 RepID=A0A917EWQ7_HALAA|nr:hypothetical protein [Halobacillus andaensis]MBP2005766.1 hypothetical protein [Halobacillus andaensis]GGF26191.1 hypothetical protein GCM10010954_26490 [Halobacillus andaensis]